MNALPSSSTELAMGDDYQGPLILSLYNRMIERSTVEEGTVDLVEGTASNDFARRRTADLLENGHRVQSLIQSQIRSNSDKISSPFMVKKYDYYFSKKYGP